MKDQSQKSECKHNCHFSTPNCEECLRQPSQKEGEGAKEKKLLIEEKSKLLKEFEDGDGLTRKELARLDQITSQLKEMRKKENIVIRLKEIVLVCKNPIVKEALKPQLEELKKLLFVPTPGSEKENELLEGWENTFKLILEDYKNGCGNGSKWPIEFINRLLTKQAKKSFKEGVESQKEIVICAAVKSADDKIFRGHRHSDCLMIMKNAGLKYSQTEESQGFITSRNRFVTRIEGRKLQDAAGIPSASRDGYEGNTLYSEDLY